MLADDATVKTTAQLTEGDLSTVPFRQLLFAYAVRRRSATLELATGQIWKRISFDAGAPVDCQSNLLHDTLGKFMVGRGDITEDQHQEYLAEKARTGRGLGEVMIELGVLSASDLYRTLQQNLGTKLLDCFLWKQGTFRVHETTEPSESALRVNPLQLLFTGVTKLTSEAELREAIEPIVGHTLIAAPPLVGADVRLKPADRELAAGLRSGLTIEAVAQVKGVPIETVMRLALGLIEVGLLVSAEAGGSVYAPSEDELAPDLTWDAIADISPPPVQAPGPAGIPPVQAPTQQATGAGKDDAQVLREDLMRVYLAHRKMDAFELLGLEESAADEDAEQAYLERSWRFAPPRFAAAGLDDLGDKARQLALAVGRAFGQVATAQARAGVIARRTDRRRMASTEAAAADQAPSELLDAALLFRKAKRLLELGSLESAVKQLQLAADCEPQNASYQAELAWARYHLSPSSAGPAALSALRQVTSRLDPRCGVAYLYTGQIQADLGHHQDAADALQIAARLLRNDSRPQDALRELQAKGGRVPGQKKSVVSRILGS